MSEPPLFKQLKVSLRFALFHIMKGVLGKENPNTGRSQLFALHLIVLYRCCGFLSQGEGKILHQQKDYESLYCRTHFISVLEPSPHCLWGKPVVICLKAMGYVCSVNNVGNICTNLLDPFFLHWSL